MPDKEQRVSLTEGELRFLYALAGRDLAGCVLDGIGGGIAGPHLGHKGDGVSALAKLGDALLGFEYATEVPDV